MVSRPFLGREVGPEGIQGPHITKRLGLRILGSEGPAPEEERVRMWTLGEAPQRGLVLGSARGEAAECPVFQEEE